MAFNDEALRNLMEQNQGAAPPVKNLGIADWFKKKGQGIVGAATSAYQNLKSGMRQATMAEKANPEYLPLAGSSITKPLPLESQGKPYIGPLGLQDPSKIPNSVPFVPDQELARGGAPTQATNLTPPQDKAGVTKVAPKPSANLGGTPTEPYTSTPGTAGGPPVEPYTKPKTPDEIMGQWGPEGNMPVQPEKPPEVGGGVMNMIKNFQMPDGQKAHLTALAFGLGLMAKGGTYSPVPQTGVGAIGEAGLGALQLYMHMDESEKATALKNQQFAAQLAKEQELVRHHGVLEGQGAKRLGIEEGEAKSKQTERNRTTVKYQAADGNIYEADVDKDWLRANPLKQGQNLMKVDAVENGVKGTVLANPNTGAHVPGTFTQSEGIQSHIVPGEKEFTNIPTLGGKAGTPQGTGVVPQQVARTEAQQQGKDIADADKNANLKQSALARKFAAEKVKDPGTLAELQKPGVDPAVLVASLIRQGKVPADVVAEYQRQSKVIEDERLETRNRITGTKTQKKLDFGLTPGAPSAVDNLRSSH